MSCADSKAELYLCRMENDTTQFKILLFASEFIITAVVFLGVILIFRNLRKKQDAEKARNRHFKR
jgi:hypothetical protein